MIDEQLAARVEAAVRAVVAAEVVPRWRRLARHEVSAKSGPHDLVTVADRAAEERLAEELPALLPGSVVVGEEAVHADPSRYDALAGDAPVWIVDPVDGTRQFVRGETGFCTLVALAHRGELLASWTYAPARGGPGGTVAHARRGAGAWVNGVPLKAGSPEPGAVTEVACSHPDYTTPEQKRALSGLWSAPGFAPRACGAAGLEYLAVASGELGGLAFSWEHSWDHAAGLLLVAEAGGAHLTLTGESFRLAGGNALPFAVGRDPDTARRILGVLIAGRPGAAA
ncbi:inositol monophosphatase family protein [Streptomyces sp. DSM 44917]|uniref:inositol-phosphate phosphatase n=1 Tax=Streptomyces boetiae TaxID=3075541 RepID=A0ABU2L2J4_9ACTN|nr:inositol monophosphatase family protein [Streptomyces sp. DSM 44917]MDT0305785.1 inositol monophosphatase family protein [Streptomyces sp. DSM 44917]